MIVLMIGGKIAPRPSLLASRSWIQRSDTSRAFSRSGRSLAASIDFRTLSMAVKKTYQKASRSVRGVCRSGTKPVRSSAISARRGTGQNGLLAQMIASGTTIVRDQDEIL